DSRPASGPRSGARHRPLPDRLLARRRRRRARGDRGDRRAARGPGRGTRTADELAGPAQDVRPRSLVQRWTVMLSWKKVPVRISTPIVIRITPPAAVIAA